MAAFSSAKFFVHRNQNKNSFSAASTFAADSDVVKSIGFPRSSHGFENLENSKNCSENGYENEFKDTVARSRSKAQISERLLLPAAAATTEVERQVQVQSSTCSGRESEAAEAAVTTATGGTIAATAEKSATIDFVDIEKEISKTTSIVRSDLRRSTSTSPHTQLQLQLPTSKLHPHETFKQDRRKIQLQTNLILSEEINNKLIDLKAHTQQKVDRLAIERSNEAITSAQRQLYSSERVPQIQSTAKGVLSLTQPQGLQHRYQQLQQQQSHQQQQQAQLSSKPAAIILNSRLPRTVMNSSQSAQGAPGNRITFTSQTLPNGTINISGAHPGASGATIISTSQLPNTTTIKTITSSAAAGAQHHTLPQQVQVQHHQVLQAPTQQGGGQPQQQHNAQSVGATQTQTLVIKSNHAASLPAGLVSSAPGIVTMTKTINQGNPPLLNSMIPASVVVGMRPPAAQQQQQQKNVQGNTLGRVVIGGPHMVSARPQSPAITLSTLAQGQQSALLLKTENGFQLLRVGTATSGPVTQTIGTNSTNPTQIRLQTVPAASMAATSAANSIVVNSVASTNSSPHVYTTQATQPQQTTNVAALHQHQQQSHLPQQQLHQQTQHLHLQPQITQIQTISAQQANSVQPGVGAGNTMNSNSVAGAGTVAAGAVAVTNTTTQSSAAQGNTKEKCRKFLANLIDLSTREPKPVEKNVRNLIQELVNANVEPEEFCDRLERLLNASPQPCLIGFLKKSLPLLRQALFTKELVIEGIKPPPQHVAGLVNIQQQLPKIQAQIRPISQNQTTTIGQTQVRMISPAAAGPRPIGHTTITKQPAGLRIQGPTSGPRLVNAQIRGPIPATIQQQVNSAQLHNSSAQANIVQIRAPTATQISRPATVQIRTAKGKTATAASITHVKVGQTQIKAIASPTPAAITTNQPPSLAAISNSLPPSATISSSSSILSTINSVVTNSMTALGGGGNSTLPTPSLPTVQLPASVLNSLADARIEVKMDGKPDKITVVTPIANKVVGKASSAAASKASSKKKKELQEKEKDDKLIASGSVSAAAASSYFQQPSMSMSSTLYGDDDINDVAAMGGVNLAEESQRILGCTENIGTQIRSCKDEVFLHLPALQARIRAMVAERGLEEPSQDVAVLISHACQERLKNIVEKLAVIAEHRIDVIKLDPRYEVTKDVRGQIKFLEELDKAEQKRHEEYEREMLLRAAKSRSKIEDPEQAKMKARAKEMQRAEMEELRQRDANMTALQAIGPRKKLKLDGDGSSAGVGTGASGALGTTGTAPVPLRPRIKRVNLRDMLFFMEQERDTCRSQMLYKAYLK